MKFKGNIAAFAKLIEYEKRSESFAPGISRDSGPDQEWSGVTFALGESRPVIEGLFDRTADQAL